MQLSYLPQASIAANVILIPFFTQTFVLKHPLSLSTFSLLINESCPLAKKKFPFSVSTAFAHFPFSRDNFPTLYWFFFQCYRSVYTIFVC